MQPYLLGVDIGTGSTKAIAVNFNGETVGMAQHYYPVNNPQPGYSEQDPEVILTAFITCVADVVKHTGASPYAISFSSAMHSIIAVDNKGKALAPMITWADSRSEDIAEKLRAMELGERIYHASGTPIHAMTPLCKLIWLKQNQTELFTLAHKFIGIKEYLWFNLFGEFEVDYAIASATGLFDIIKLDWNPEALEIAGITQDKLSKPVNNDFKRTRLNTTIAQQLTIAADTPFIIGASDGCCANLGSFVTEPGVASLTIGTSGAVRITGKQPVYNYANMIFNYLLNEQTFVCGGAVNNGGIVLNWLIKAFAGKNLPGQNDYDYAFAQMATVEAGSEGLIFLPYLYGERAPIWDTKSCGVYMNIKPQHTASHFLRAGLEGICFALNDVIDSVERSSAAIDRLHISGGFISSPVWVQMLADITQKKLIILQQEDASAMGAIFLADQALGLGKLGEKQPEDEVSISPNVTKQKVYTDQFVKFKRLYNDLKETMHWLHKDG